MPAIIRKDMLAGACFVLFGAFFALESLNYEIGTAFRMGPGFMPLALGCALALLGVAVAAQTLRQPAEEEGPAGPIPWRGIILILGTVAFFGLCLRGLGFVPVVLIGSFATAMASTKNSPVFAALLAIALCVMCVAIFVIGLGLTVPLIGPWLRWSGA